MNTKLYFYIALRIIFLFGIAMASSYLPENLRDFFGDTKFVPYSNGIWVHNTSGGIDENWVWGTRHYWFFSMMVLLFLLSGFDAVLGIRNMVIKYYPEI